jgi:hypothetical protein
MRLRHLLRRDIGRLSDKTKFPRIVRISYGCVSYGRVPYRRASHGRELKTQYIGVRNISPPLATLHRQLLRNSSISALSYSLPGIAICYIVPAPTAFQGTNLDLH